MELDPSTEPNIGDRSAINFRTVMRGVVLGWVIGKAIEVVSVKLDEHAKGQHLLPHRTHHTEKSVLE